MTATARPQRSSNHTRNSPRSDAPTVNDTGDLGTIQSILFGDFSAQTEARIAALEDLIVESRAAADARAAALETALAKERRERRAAVAALEEAREELRASQAKLLGKVKADVTRSRTQLRSEIETARTASVDRGELSQMLRSMADLVAGAADNG